MLSAFISVSNLSYLTKVALRLQLSIRAYIRTLVGLPRASTELFEGESRNFFQYPAKIHF